MATIATFEHIGDSEYLGDIFTLSLRAKNVRIVSVSRTNENAPSHRIYIDQVAVGASWSKRSNEGRDYLPATSSEIVSSHCRDSRANAFDQASRRAQTV
jgi:uncharacterized protein (DUF736 family)